MVTSFAGKFLCLELDFSRLNQCSFSFLRRGEVVCWENKLIEKQEMQIIPVIFAIWAERYSHFLKLILRS